MNRFWDIGDSKNALFLKKNPFSFFLLKQTKNKEQKTKNKQSQTGFFIANEEVPKNKQK